jgi:hypothetical protein
MSPTEIAAEAAQAASAMLPKVPASPVNQLIPQDAILVRAAAEYDVFVLDIYATFDADDGYELAAITIHGDKRQMIGLLEEGCVKTFERWIELDLNHSYEMSKLRDQLRRQRAARDLRSPNRALYSHVA